MNELKSLIAKTVRDMFLEMMHKSFCEFRAQLDPSRAVLQLNLFINEALKDSPTPPTQEVSDSIREVLDFLTECYSNIVTGTKPNVPDNDEIKKRVEEKFASKYLLFG